MTCRFARRLGRTALPAVALLAWHATVEAGPPQGTPLMITLPPEVLGYSEGANGLVVAGTFFSGGAFCWMPTSGVTAIGGTQGVAVSRDGKVIVGNALDSGGLEHAAIWTGGKSWRLLGSVRTGAQSCDRALSAAFGANEDGRVIVGLAWDGCKYARAFRWEESTGVADLGSLGGGQQSTRANGVSGDGRVVVGWEQATTGFRQGAKWVDGKEELIRGSSGLVGEAFATNRDGSLIVGTNCDPMAYTGPPTAWTWTQAAGVRCYPVQRPSWVVPLAYQALMQTTSNDGRVIGGALSFGLESQALVWFDGEPVFLRDYLRSNGIPDAFDGWVNTGFVTDVSNDGRTLVGYGAGPKTFQGYIVILPEPGAK
jgi:probable HAF family extracellular repeat protein